MAWTAVVGGDVCDCDVWATALVSPPPIRDEMDMLLPGRCTDPRPGSSLLAAKAEAYGGRAACDAWCCWGDDGGGMCARANDGGAGVS